MSASDAGLVPDDFNELLAQWGEKRAPVMLETWGRNDGPELREWLRLVRLDKPAEWCAATVYAAAHDVSKYLGIVNPCPRTAGALKLYTLSDPVTHVVVPRRGCLLILDHGKGKGHAGVITAVFPDGTLSWWSGNTNAEGSRTGDSLLIKTGDPEEVHHADLVGFVDLSKAPTRPLAA